MTFALIGVDLENHHVAGDARREFTDARDRSETALADWANRWGAGLLDVADRIAGLEASQVEDLADARRETQAERDKVTDLEAKLQRLVTVVEKATDDLCNTVARGAA